MTFAASSIPAFRAALIEALEARPGMKGVPVTDGKPEPEVLASEEFLAILQTNRNVAPRPIERTTQPRDERYVQHGMISVVGGTRTSQTTLGARAFEILAELESQLRETVRLEGYYTGPGNVYSVVVAHSDYDTRADDQRREASIEFSLDVHARI